jgi:hypothetical protein
MIKVVCVGNSCCFTCTTSVSGIINTSNTTFSYGSRSADTCLAFSEHWIMLDLRIDDLHHEPLDLEIN